MHPGRHRDAHQKKLCAPLCLLRVLCAIGFILSKRNNIPYYIYPAVTIPTDNDSQLTDNG